MKKRVLFFAVVAMFAAIGWAQTPELDQKIADLQSEEFSESIEWLNKLEKELKPHYRENDSLYAVIAYRKGEVYSSEFQYEKAIEERKKAISIFEKLGGNDEDIADLWGLIGNDYNNLGKISEAVDAHKKALDICKRVFGENNTNTASAYNNLAVDYTAMDKFDEAWKYYEKVIAIIEKVAGPKSLDTAIAYFNVGLFFYNKGDISKSFEYYEKSLSIVEKNASNDPFMANCYNAIAGNYAAIGDEEKSFAYSQKALKMALKSYGEDNPEIRVFCNSYASKLQEHARVTGDVDSLIQATDYYGKTINLSAKYKIFDDHMLSACFDYGWFLESLGPNGWIKDMILSDSSQDVYDGVIENLKKSINTTIPPDLGKTIYPDYKGTKIINDGARLLYNMALWIRQNFAGITEDGFVADLYHRIGVTYENDGNSQEAKKYFKKSLDINKKVFGEFSPACATLYFDMGYFAHQAGDNKTAVAEWKKCLKSLEGSQNYSYAIDRVKDILYCKVDDKAFTAQAINFALSAAEKARLDSDSKKSSIMKKILPVYYYAVKFSAEQNDAKKAFEYSEQMRSRAFLDQMGVEEALKLKGITDAQRDSVRGLMKKISGLKKSFDEQNSLPISDRDSQEMTRLAKELSEAEKKLALLDAEISKKVPRYAQLRNPQTVTAAQAQAWCLQNRAVVEYVLWSDDYIGAGNENNSTDSYCIVLTKSGAQIIKLDNAFDYSSCVNALRKKIISGAAEQDFEKERNDLYARLCEPLVAKLGKEITELVIVPDGNLSFLPFDILRKNSFDKDFGESYSIELSPSISISYLLGKNSSSMGNALAFGGAWYDESLTEAQHRQMFENAAASVKKNSRKIQAVNVSPNEMSANQREAIEEIIAQKGIGGYLASKNGHWGNLPGTLTEVNRLQSNVFSAGAMTLKTQDQVTENSVKKLSSDGQLLRYPILHFACHGYFDKYVPEICSLVFSEVSGKFSKVSNDDGYLTVPEVSVLDLNADMVCLSACETGMGEIRSGDGLVGLSRGFMVAGAKNVGVSLWSVDDEATSEFMVRMYKKRKEGMNYVDAYRAVKNEFRKDSQWSHPFYWAAFTLYGGAGNAGTAFAAQNLKNDKSAAEDAYQRALSAKDNGEYSSALALSLEAANAGHVGAQGLLSQLYYEGKGINRDYAKALEWANKAAKKNDPRGLNTLGLANYYGNGAKVDGKKGEAYLIKAAAAGLADAQVNLGNIYSSDRSARMNKAVEYYSMAAEQGDVRAEYALGVLYFNGNGVPQNYYTALDFFKRAANKNNGRACNDIGLMYQYEYGVQKDESLALEYFLKGAELGDAMAQSNAGYIYETRGEISKAVYWYEKSAEQNYAASQRRLGNIFQSGYQTGVKGTPDYSRAKDLFEKASAQNDALAQHYLARIYYEGKGIQHNYFKAFEFEKKAAENGLAEAQFWTGCMYEFGQGVNADINAANDWYKKASANGDVRGTYNLGFNYWNGVGVGNDYVTAFELFNRVVEKGQSFTNEYLDSLCYLGCAYNLGLGTKQDYSKALEWYKKAADLGQKSAQHNLAIMYENGQGVKQDYAKAFEWYQKSAAQGNADSQCNIGFLYENGRGVKQSDKKAFEWYKKSSENGCATAQRNLGLMYENGKGCEKSFSEARNWYQKAADQGDSTAQHILARIYYDGRGVAVDYAKAFEYENKAAWNGVVEAQYWLGYMYDSGKGVAANAYTANGWYEKAVAGGDVKAAYELGHNYWKGKGWSKNEAKAFELFNKVVASNQTSLKEYIYSMFFLGCAYDFGRGVKQDYYKAMEWYQKAAAQGDADAQNNIGAK